MGIRADRYKAMVPQVVGPLTLKGRVHADEARFPRPHHPKLKFTLPGPMTIVDTVADRYYGDKVKMAFAFAELLNQEARRWRPTASTSSSSTSRPSTCTWTRSATGASPGAGARRRRASAAPPPCTSATATASRPTSTGRRRWASEWRQYEEIFPALAKSRIDQVAMECSTRTCRWT